MTHIKIVPKQIRFKIYKDLQKILLTFEEQGVDMSIESSHFKSNNMCGTLGNKNISYVFDAYAGFCSQLSFLMYHYFNWKIACLFSIRSFPELMKYKPNGIITGYWGNNQWRLKVINEILNNEQIKQTNKSNKNNEK